jgi:glycosyltransferase involved in cell wall biosynthesis
MMPDETIIEDRAVMERKPKVSVHVITRNHRPYVEAALNRVLDNGYGDIEIVVGDDCSDDGSREILREFQRLHPETVRLILGESQVGVAGNANRILKALRGRYVAFFSGDDVLLPGKIAAQVEMLDANADLTICYHDVEVFSDDDAFRPYPFSRRHKMYRGNIETLIRYGCFFPTNTVMMRRAAIPAHGFLPQLDYSGDTYFFIESLKDGGAIDFIPKVFGRYRRHGNNVSNVYAKEIAVEEWREVQIIARYFPQYDKALDRYRSDLHFIEAVRAMRAKQFCQAFRQLAASLRSARGFWTAPRIATPELCWRLHQWIRFSG